MCGTNKESDSDFSASFIFKVVTPRTSHFSVVLICFIFFLSISTFSIIFDGAVVYVISIWLFHNNKRSGGADLLKAHVT